MNAADVFDDMLPDAGVAWGLWLGRLFDLTAQRIVSIPGQGFVIQRGKLGMMMSHRPLLTLERYDRSGRLCLPGNEPTPAVGATSDYPSDLAARRWCLEQVAGTFIPVDGVTPMPELSELPDDPLECMWLFGYRATNPSMTDIKPGSEVFVVHLPWADEDEGVRGRDDVRELLAPCQLGGGGPIVAISVSAESIPAVRYFTPLSFHVTGPGAADDAQMAAIIAGGLDGQDWFQICADAVNLARQSDRR